MSSTSKDSNSKGSVPSLLNDDRGKSKAVSKGNDLEQIRQNLAKRSLNVKFDLEGSDYKAVENIGAGAYGVVCSAIHKRTGDRVAIKKTTHVFEVLLVAKRTYREIKILKHFKHDNIICIREILLPKEDVKSFKDVYIVFDLMESDLHHIIYSRQSLSEEHVRYFLYQILRGLKYIHSANVVHRDLKPSNLLVNEDCHLRIGDFGMARGIFYTPDEPSYYMTQYVATRWYRAPEILLSMLEYGTAVDMWSVGCIFAEMMGRKHLFPGKDYMSQVKLILGVLGTPPESLMKSCQNDILKRIIKSFGKKAPEPWEKLFPNASKKSIDLLSKMLVLNPSDRITVDQALSHRLLNHYHDPDDEPICVPAFNFDFEKEEMDMPCLRTAIMKEIMSFHQPKPPSLSFSAFLRPAPKEEEKSYLKPEYEALKPSLKDLSESEAPDQKPQMAATDSQAVSQEKEAPADTKTAGSSSKKSSPVSSIMTARSELAPPCIDVEMLSAQSQDGMDIQSIIEAASQPPPKESTTVGEKPAKEAKSVSEKRGGNTISEDTKALVKQALLNATQRRQRAESHGEEVDKSKPITAAQRQKEREEKRRKKKEKAKQKVRKTKDKKVVAEKNVSLSSEDVELLKRWMGMQAPQDAGRQNPSPPQTSPNLSPPQTNNGVATQVSQGQASNQETSFSKASLRHFIIKGTSKHRHILAKTIAPSISVSKAIPVSSSHLSSGGSMLISSSHMKPVPSTFIPVIAMPSITNPGKIEIKRIVHTTQPQPSSLLVNSESSNSSTDSRSSLASGSTKTLLQNAILLRNSNTNAPNSRPASQSDLSVSISKEAEASSSFLQQSQSNLSQPEDSHGSHRNESSGGAARNTGRTSEVVLSYPLKEFQGLSKIGTAMDNSIPPAQESPDILEFLSNMKTPQDSPSCFDNTSFPSPDLTTPDATSDLTSFTSLNFSPTPTYPFHQSPEQARTANAGPNLPGSGQHPQQNSSQLQYGNPDIFQGNVSTKNVVSGFATVPFQQTHAPREISVTQTAMSMQDSSSSALFSSSSHLSPEAILFPGGSHPSVSSFNSSRTGGESSSSSVLFSENLFQHSNHPSYNLLQNHHQPMQFQQSDAPHQSPPHPQIYASAAQGLTVVTTSAVTSSSYTSTSPSNPSALLPHPSQDFTFHSNPSSEMDFFSQQQQQHQPQQQHLQQLQNHHSQQPQQNPYSPPQQQQQHSYSPPPQQQQQPYSPPQQQQQPYSPPQQQQQHSYSPPQQQPYSPPQQQQQHSYSPPPQQQQQPYSPPQQQQQPYSPPQQQQQHSYSPPQQQPYSPPQQQQQHSYSSQQQQQHSYSSPQQNPYSPPQQQQQHSYSPPHQQQHSFSPPLQQQQQHPFSQQQQQQQQHLFSMQEQRQAHSFSQQQQQQPQQSQPFSQPNHYHHLQTPQQNFLAVGAYDSATSAHDRSLHMTPETPGMSMPFSLSKPSDVTLSSAAISEESPSSYYGMTYEKEYPSASGKGGQLTVNTQKDKRMLLNPNKDLIALLSKQLSKSQVADNCPPALALTPRGTGAGYGLGMDLDSMLTDAQDHTMTMRVEQSPLSSSLLADWLDISSSISQADIDALEQEMALQSPMHVSYNDVNL